MTSEFEHLVLEKCRDLQLSVLSVLGRGSTVLLGPLETPEIPGCVTCLQLRWENTFDHSLLKMFQGIDSIEEPLAMSPSDLLTLGDIVADEIQSIVLASSHEPNCRGQVGLYEQAEDIEWVPVVPNHDCPRCNLIPDDHPSLAQVEFVSQRVIDTEALRVAPVDYKRLETLFVHPKVGYISNTHEFSNEGRYVEAGAYIYTPSGAEIAGYGSGLTSIDAKQSAMLEVLERSCGFQAVNRRPVTFGKYSELNGDAMHPSKFGLHTDAWLQSSNYEPFAEEKPYSWIWAYSTKRQLPVLIPEQMAYYGPTADALRFVKETSNGCAMGGTVEEATLHGTFEVIERDGFLNMWYAKMPLPELRLGNHCPPKTSKAFRYLVDNGFEVRLFNMSHDLSIPTICAVAVNKENDYPKVVSGSACHLNPYQAVYGALRELTVQVLNLQRTSEERRKEALSMFLDSTKIKDILDHVAVAGLPEAYPRWAFLLRPENRRQTQSVEDVYQDVARRYQIHSCDIRRILNAVLEDLHSRGFDVIVLNQTSAEVSYAGLHAVKVFIPGMTPITFGYGAQRVRGLSRLFELPQRMGYAKRVLTEDDLNQDCHPFS
ncbi:TOMM precursor leader peptide-binding protein [Alicyclobacillus acidoterrestris]|uniref:TOMM leader peptide-binding protein n=2 Tax=Alicyclobacillus acidoterrestris TaxID=1450 RepID=A0A9E6ZRX2_ALIAG|nr:TOMM precursor leader peptide-binding protein [Alicyclobacillus acidoterrestris]UNO50804.1 TOMM precursor leader peptide-binding protein [Alicyclobacillus acidoterrestris]